MNLVPRLISAVACTLAAGALSLPSQAASAEFPGDGFTWTAGSGFWDVSANWLGGVVPVSGPTTRLSFNGSLANGTSINNLGATGFELNQLHLSSNGASAANLNGHPLRLSGPDAGIFEDSSGPFNVGVPLQIAAPTLLGGAGSGVLILNGAISGASPILMTNPGVVRLGSAGPSFPSANTFYGGFILSGGLFSFANSTVTARTAMRSNPVLFSSVNAQLIAGSELRIGELKGVSGSVAALGEVAPYDGHNILIYAMGEGQFNGALRTISAGAADGPSGTLTLRGCAMQTLSGSVDVNDAVVVAHGAGLILSGNATLSNGDSTILSFEGGSLILDNREFNLDDRLRDTDQTLSQLDSLGGGTLRLIGNAKGTHENAGLLELGSLTNSRSGAMEIAVTHTAGKAASTVLSLLALSRDDADSPHTTVNFSAADAFGKDLALGLAGNNPRIIFQTPPVMNNGILAPTSAVPNPTASDPTAIVGEDRVGWATVGGAHYATYGVNGIAAVLTKPLPAKSSGKTNAVLRGSATIASDSAFSLTSLEIAPTAANQRFTLSRKGSLRTNAVLLAGPRDFSILNGTGGTGGFEGRGGSRYVTVQEAMLSFGLFLGIDYGLVKAGDGTLALTHPGNANLTKTITLNGGTLRAAPGTTLPSGRIEFRGGVLEIDGGGFHTFALGTDQSQINWRGGTLSLGQSVRDKGSGGFSAFGGDATVTVLGKAGTNLAWEDSYFIDSNHALIFGSKRANFGVTFASNLTLLGAATKNINYNAREIRVIDNPLSNRDFARMSGQIVGAPLGDLLKTGDGILDLSADNSAFEGGIIVAQGTLSTSQSRGFGGENGAYILLGMRSGTASSALLASNTDGAITIAREIGVEAGTTGAAILGNTLAPDATSTGDAIFAGRIVLGITGGSVGRPVLLHAQPGTTVTFSGPIETVAAYTGTMNLETNGEGTVVLAGPNTYSGDTLVTSGILQVGRVGAIPSTSRLVVAGGATFSLNGFPQSIAALSGQGSVILDGTTLSLGADGRESQFDGTLSGNGDLQKLGAGKLTLTGAVNSYSGATIVSGGTLVLANRSGSATGSGTLVVKDAGRVEGSGSVSGPLTVFAGGTLSPGAGVGTLASGPATYSSASTYRFEIKDAAAAGAGKGFDLHKIQGTLKVDATPAAPLRIEIHGLDASNVSGKILRFNSASDYAWVIASASEGITGFDPARVLIDSSDFANHNAIGAGTFSLAQRGNELVLFFTGSPLGGAGTYNGLIENALADHGGYLRLATTRTGSFSGLLKYAGQSFSLRGSFDATGHFSGTIARGGGQSSLSVNLLLDVANNRLSGSVSDGSVSSTLSAGRGIYTAANSPVPEAGYYTLILPPDPLQSGANYPQGPGYGRLTAGAAGSLKATGKLADGTPFSMGAFLDAQGNFPFYVGLYVRRNAPLGALRGEVSFADTPGQSDFHGQLQWDKPPQPTGAFYPSGFVGTSALVGARYRIPSGSNAALGFSVGIVEFGKGILPEPGPIHILLGAKSLVTVTDTPNVNRLKLSVAPRTGLFGGSFQLPGQAATAFSGVLFQKQGTGSALLLRDGESTTVNFAP